MQQELLDRYPGESLAVFIIWAPMMDSDSEPAARESAAAFDSKRVTQFYDPGRNTGTAFRKDVFPDAYDQAFASLPRDHFMHGYMPEMKSRHANSPEWDIYMFFSPGVTWRAAPPRPSRFVRHLGRIVDKDGESLSLMWIDAYSNPPVEGKLPAEIGRLGRELLQPDAVPLRK